MELKLISIQMLLFSFLSIYVVKKLRFPKVLKAQLYVVFITMPVYVAQKGAESLLYLSDFLTPFLMLFIAIRYNPLKEIKQRYVLIMLLFLLIFIPLLNGMIVSIIDGRAHTQREILAMLVWFYRNFTYFIVFTSCLLLNMTHDEYSDFVKANLYYGLALGALGLLNYFGNIDMAVFERIKSDGELPEWFSQNRLGLGFLGLFRASVGQWFVLSLALVLGSYRQFTHSHKFTFLIFFVLAAIDILASFSRAGFVGLVILLVVSCFWWKLFSTKQVIAALLVAPMLILLLINFNPKIADRFTAMSSGNIDYNETSLSLRTGSVERSNNYFTDNILSLVFGIGPTNREGIYEICGTYGAHNEYYDIVFREGLFGLLILLLVLFYIYKCANFNYDDFNTRQRARTLGTILIVNVCFGLSQNHLIHDYASHTLGVYIYLLYGCLLGTIPEATKSFSQKYQLIHC